MDPRKLSSIKRNKKKWFGKERKTRFRQTNLNNRYFMRLIKKQCDDYLTANGEQIKKEQPEVYYSMKNKPLPKKYQKQEKFEKVHCETAMISSVDRKDELDAYQKKREEERKLLVEKFRSEQNTTTKIHFSVDRKDPNRGMRFVNAYGSVNTSKFGHSQSWKYKKEKKRSYYW